MSLVTVTRGGKKGRGKKVFGLEGILKELRKRRARAGLDSLSEVAVGYSADYAAPVHERLDVVHPVGQAKFLEQPLRTEQKVIKDIIRKKLQGRQSLTEANLAAADHVMKVSMTLVPVKTGHLRNSWFIRVKTAR